GEIERKSGGEAEQQDRGHLPLREHTKEGRLSAFGIHLRDRLEVGTKDPHARQNSAPGRRFPAGRERKFRTRGRPCSAGGPPREEPRRGGTLHQRLASPSDHYVARRGKLLRLPRMAEKHHHGLRGGSQKLARSGDGGSGEACPPFPGSHVRV